MSASNSLNNPPELALRDFALGRRAKAPAKKAAAAKKAPAKKAGTAAKRAR